MRLALVLMGGGARAAYQVGVLKALAEIAREADPLRHTTPFAVVCGSSAGAINATSIASHADDFSHGVRRLLEFWEPLRADYVYRTDWLGIAAAGARWLATMTFGWAARRSPRGLLDNAPLAHLLQRELSFHRIEQMLESRLLHALSITALSYSSGRHLTFYQAAEPIQAWRRAQRTARLVDLSASHLLASSAIPFVFPAVPLVLDGQIEYFGDGSIRQVAPLSPAIHFGADRIVVIGAADPRPEIPAPNGSGLVRGYPTLAQIGQQVLASVFLDSIGSDIERIEHINRMIEHLPHQVRTGQRLAARRRARDRAVRAHRADRREAPEADAGDDARAARRGRRQPAGRRVVRELSAVRGGVHARTDRTRLPRRPRAARHAGRMDRGRRRRQRGGARRPVRRRSAGW